MTRRQSKKKRQVRVNIDATLVAIFRILQRQYSAPGVEGYRFTEMNGNVKKYTDSFCKIKQWYVKPTLKQLRTLRKKFKVR